MKNMSTKNKILYAIICIIIIIGAIVCYAKGFKFEMQYAKRSQIILSNKTGFDISKIKEITKNELNGKEFLVSEVEIFGNAVSITTTDMTEEEKTKIIDKINQEYSLEISADNVEIKNIAHTRIRDILKPYILPGIITFAVVLLYFLIRYRKLGASKVLLNGILFPIAMELVFYSIVAIGQIPFGRVTLALSIGLYVVAITILAAKFEKLARKQQDIEVKKEN